MGCAEIFPILLVFLRFFTFVFNFIFCERDPEEFCCEPIKEGKIRDGKLIFSTEGTGNQTKTHKTQFVMRRVETNFNYTQFMAFETDNVEFRQN